MSITSGNVTCLAQKCEMIGTTTFSDFSTAMNLGLGSEKSAFWCKVKRVMCTMYNLLIEMLPLKDECFICMTRNFNV